ncbi:hypothetical protein PRIPAC_78166 [Pristionchus pacificus]|uniref:glucuronosyltransferase n=1 Tax=Pristionchus pacificus TaxID=54126 RepID=A0A2A6CJW6_PRIPA|nr:hypothetical protein PRIPAC_78166 [Pristionchus pacificus]|eukprot:PDM78419.1 ugt-54 [Pristionchus pacificus]
MHLLSLLISFPCALSLNILMYVNVAGKSHLQFAEKLIALLNERGHNVDVVLGMLNSYVSLKGTYGARQLVTVNFPGESPWGQVAYHLNNPFVEIPDWQRLSMESNKFIDTNQLLCDLLLDSTAVADLMSSNKYDIALMSGYDFCPFALAHHHKISPVVSYVPTPIYYYTQSYYAGLPELPLYENVVFDVRHTSDRSSFVTRVYETLRTFKERLLHYNDLIIINSKLRARFGDSFPDVREIAMNTSLDFTNSHPLLEEPRPTSLRLKYIGGIGLPTPKPLKKELDNMLNLAAKGNVIFSFGTQIGPEKITPELQRVFVNTFKRFPEYNFLWKFDGKTVMNASNVFNLDWMPQTDLLYDDRVHAFISHFGLNSFTETACAGVPAVAIPLFGDQHHNARRAVALGAAVMVRKTEITEANLYEALAKVLRDERYRKRAKEIASMISALPDTPQRIFLEGIEFAAKFNNLPFHYRLAGAKHNFFVQLGWDVAAFLTVVVFLVVVVAMRLSFFVLNRIRAKFQVKSKKE